MSESRQQKAQKERIKCVQTAVSTCVADLGSEYSAADIAAGLGRALIAAMKLAGMTVMQISNQFNMLAQQIRDRTDTCE